MKKLFYFFTLLVIFTCNCIGQTASFNWVKQMGGYRQDIGWSIAADNKGNVITVGTFRDTADFDPGAGMYKLIPLGGQHIFISKLDSSGKFLWAKSIASKGDFDVAKVVADKSGNVIVGGYFSKAADFDLGPGVNILTPQGLKNGFILKLDPNGNFIWVCHLKTQTKGLNQLEAIALDNDDNIYADGYYTDSLDIITSKGSLVLLPETGISDGGFVLKIDASGGLRWAKSASGFGQGCIGLIIDKFKNIYATGRFKDTRDFATGSAIFNMTSTASSYDMFVAKLDSNGSLLWAKQMGGPSTFETPLGKPSVDKSGNVYVSGHFIDTADFDPSPLSKATLESTPGSNWAGFVFSLDKNGDFRWVRKTANAGQASSTATDSFDNIYVTGGFSKSAIFEPKLGGGKITLNTIATADFFVLMLDSWGNFVWAKQSSGPAPTTGYMSNYGSDVSINKSGNVFCTGGFSSTNFDPDESNPQSLKMYDTLQEGSFSRHDIFVIKYSVSGLRSSGLQENKLSSPLPKIFPNPNSGELYVSYDKPVRMIITDIMGRVHLSTQVSFKADISSLTDGIYFVKITDELVNVLTLEKIQKISGR